MSTKRSNQEQSVGFFAQSNHRLLNSVKTMTSPSVSAQHFLAPRLWHVDPLEVADLRVVICFDAGFATNHILFDSSCHGPQARRSRRQKRSSSAKDSGLLLRLLFGTAPISGLAESTKIHDLLTENQFMISRLWPDDAIEPLLLGGGGPQRQGGIDQSPHTRSRASTASTAAQDAEPSPSPAPQLTQNQQQQQQQPRTPSRASSAAGQINSALLEEHENDLSSIPRSVGGVSSPSSRRSLSGSSATSTDIAANLTQRSRRLQRSMRSNIEYGVSQMSVSSSSSKRRPCAWGVGLIVNLQRNTLIKRFLVTHFALVEHLLARFQEDLAAIAHAIALDMRQQSGRDSTTPTSGTGPATTTTTAAAAAAAATASPSSSSSALRSNRGRDSGSGRRRLPLSSFALRLQRSGTCARLVDAFRTALIQLYSQPRIQEPVWLNLSTFSRLRPVIHRQFMLAFNALTASLGAQDGLSQLVPRAVTAVLALHLGWVGTVAPPSDAAADQLTKCSPSSAHKQASSHPYDPLWAQLTDLYGACASPPRVSRTIVVGQDPERVRQLLYVLTYFLRCNEVLELHLAKKRYAITPAAHTTHGGALGEAEGAGSKAEGERATGRGGDGGENGGRSSGSNEDEDASASQEDMVEVDMRSSVCLRVHPDLSADAVAARVKTLSHIAGHAGVDKEHLFSRSLGRSLHFMYTHTFITGAVLQGLPKLNFLPSLEQELRSHVRFGMFGERVHAASCAIINADTGQVEVVTVRSSPPAPGPGTMHGANGGSSGNNNNGQVVSPTDSSGRGLHDETEHCGDGDDDDVDADNPLSVSRSSSLFPPAAETPGAMQTPSATSTSAIAASTARVEASAMVTEMLDVFSSLAEEDMPPDLCFDHLEDRLAVMYTQSQLLSALLEEEEERRELEQEEEGQGTHHAMPSSLSQQQQEVLSEDTIAQRLCVGKTDVPLLLAVAGTFDPRAHERMTLSPQYRW